MTVISGITHDNWRERQKEITLPTGITMAYMEAGDPEKAPLVLVHGFLNSGRVWQYMFQFLEKDFHIFAVDLRGSGQSDAPVQFAYPIVQHGMDVAAFIEELGLKNIFLVGHSMGGMVSQAAGYILQQRIRKIILVSTAARMNETPAMIREFSEMFENYAETLPSVDELMPRHKAYPCQENVRYYMEDLKRFPNHYFAAAWWGMSMTDNRNFLQFIKAPVKVIWGKDDDIFLKEFQDELCRLLPNADFTVYDNAGHEVVDETPEQLCRDIRSFFLE